LQASKNNLDQFIRSNIDNEQNGRNTKTEKPMDMLPCRQTIPLRNPMTWAEGENIQLPIRWNNPHNSECEVS